MIAPRFYIFGVPDGFDILDGSKQEISYFQRFYDGSPEDTKFTMHRDSNGNVTYTFLKYNLSSCKSRTGSFFGMSLAFSGVYCNHPLRLYELFDYVYQNQVLYSISDASKGILKPIVNSDIKAQYLITRFEDRKEHINFVEKVFQHNLATDGMLMSSFCPLDPGFKNEKQNLVVKLPLVEKFKNEDERDSDRGRFEEELIGLFREYSYVTISPDWEPRVSDHNIIPDLDVEIAPQKIVQWKDLIQVYQRYIIQGLGNLFYTVLDEVKRYQKQTEEILDQLKKYPYNKNIAPSIPADYEELCNQLNDLYQMAVTAQSEGGGTTSPDPIPPTPTPSPRNGIKDWISDNKSKIVGIMGVAAVAVVILVLFWPKKDAPRPPIKTPYCCVERVDSLIGEALSRNDFTKAAEIADSISDNDFKEEKLALVEEGVKHYHTILDGEINILIGEKKWKDAFEKTGGYYGEKAKIAKLDQIRTACVNYFNFEISELTPNNYSQKARILNKELNDIKDYIENDYNSLKDKIDKKKPEVINPPTTTTYIVEFYKAGSNYEPVNSTPTRTFETSGNINVGSDHYIYKIKKDGNYLIGEELNKAVKASITDLKVAPRGSDYDNLRLWLPSSSNGTLTIGNIKITVN